MGSPSSFRDDDVKLPGGLGDEGYALRVISRAPVRLLVAGGEPVGVQRGAYALLERLGVGFYLGGDALPELRKSLLVPTDLDEVRQPIFRVRGSLPWCNFLNSPTTWDLEDYQVFFDQMAKMGNNFVGFHSYDSDPFCAYPWEGVWRMGAPAATSLNYGWGTVRGLKTDKFGFGTGRYFPYEVFGSRSATLSTVPDAAAGALFPRKTEADESILRAQAVLAQGLEYAKRRGVRLCVGFELTGDPTNEENRREADARIRNLLATFPSIDYVWFWQTEGLGEGSRAPADDSPLDLIVQNLRPVFEGLGSENRLAEAARVTAWVQFAHAVAIRLRPDIRVIVSGWGGDAGMRFSDFYVGLDEVLPKDIIFAALDNIDPTAQPHVSDVYGKLSDRREKWPIPWFESDGGGTRRDQWLPQANVKPFVSLIRNARATGCQGFVGIHWQTRGVEEVAAYTAQHAWNPALSYEEFYATFARKCFGEASGPEMAAILMRLEALGPRWTGGPGQIECAGFQWFSDDRRPRDENIRALEEIETSLARIALGFREGSSRRHAERLRYLRQSINFAVAFDRAAADLAPGGRIAVRVDEAEVARRDGKSADAARLAREAFDAMIASPLREAMEAYAARLTSQGDFGNLAAINVKAYAAFLELWERAGAALGEHRPPPGADLRLEHTELVVKNPPTALPEAAPFTVRALAFGDRPVTSVVLRFRALGAPWSEKAMVGSGRNLFEAEIPGDIVGPRGVEYAVEARDERGVTAVAPVGFPDAVFTASALPFSAPALYGPCLHRGAAFAPWHSVEGAGKPAFLRFAAIPSGEYEKCSLVASIRGNPTRGECVFHMGVIPVDTDDRQLVVSSWQARDSLGRSGEGVAATFGLSAQPASPAALRAVVVEPFHVRLTWEAPPCAHWEVHRSEMAGFDPSVETLLARWAWRVFDDVSLEPGKPWQYAVLTVDDSGEKSVAARSETVRMENVPLPPMPMGVQAAPGRGHVALRWEEVPGHVRGYAVFVADATGVKRVSGEEFVKGTEFVVWLDGGGSRRFSVRAADRAKRLGPPSNEVEAAPLPPPHDPVFFTALQGERAATGQEGRLAGRARLGADGLDTRDGGWIAYPPEELLQPGAPLTIELWVDIDRIEGIPVLISYGHWEGPGWWLQLIGGKIQFYLPVQKILDAGTLPTGGWHHLAATYDGGISRLFVDGKEAGSLDVGPVNPAPWGGELRIGTYSEDALAFQTFGRIGPVGIWRRALPAQEIRARFAIGR